MANLEKFNLGYNKHMATWDRTEGKKRTVESYDTKAEALKGGVLEGAVGKGGGSVKIRKIDSSIQEERTYPRSKDPKGSKG